MKSKKSLGSSRVQSNLLQQNCYVRDCSLKSDLSTPVVNKSYESLSTIPCEDGFREDFVTVPYEITPQYVNSFLASSDYKRDPVNSVVSSVPRVNLGDVRDIQKASSMDMSEARALFDKLRVYLDSVQGSEHRSEQAQSSVDGSFQGINKPQDSTKC